MTPPLHFPVFDAGRGTGRGCDSTEAGAAWRAGAGGDQDCPQWTFAAGSSLANASGSTTVAAPRRHPRGKRRRASVPQIADPVICSSTVEGVVHRFRAGIARRPATAEAGGRDAAAGAARSEEADMRGLLRRLRQDDGMTTAEYAVGTIAACAFAAVLYKVVTSSSVLSALGRIIRSALEVHL